MLKKLPPSRPKINISAEPTEEICAVVLEREATSRPQPVAAATAASTSSRVANGSPQCRPKSKAVPRMRMSICATPVMKMPNTLPANTRVELVGETNRRGSVP